MWDVFRVSSDKLALCHLELMRKMNDLIRDMNKYGDEQVKIHRKVRMRDKKVAYYYVCVCLSGHRHEYFLIGCPASSLCHPDLIYLTEYPVTVFSLHGNCCIYPKVSSTMMICTICLCVCMCVYAYHPDKGGDGGDSGGGAGAAGSEWSPSEVQRRLPHQMFGTGPPQKGGSSAEGTRES